MSRRGFLRFGALAPLAPVAGAVTAKLGTVGSGLQRVTAQSAVKELLANLAGRSGGAQRFTIEKVEYVGDRLGVVRYVERYAYEAVAPSIEGQPAPAISRGVTTTTYTAIFNAGTEAVRYLGRIIPPGQWTHIH